METPEEFLEQLNIDPKKFVTVRQELGASSGSAYMLKDLLEDYAKLKNHGDIGDVSKRFEIDFDGNVKARIEMENNVPKVYGAMNGWGNGISPDHISITEINDC